MNLREVVRLVAILNIAYFGLEISVGLWIGSVSMFADSIDFLEDAAINLLVLVSIGWSASRRSAVGMLLAAVLLVPCIATFVMAGYKFSVPFAPSPLPLILIGIGALMINLGCAYMLTRCRRSGGNMVSAALSATRYDIFANLAIAGYKQNPHQARGRRTPQTATVEPFAARLCGPAANVRLLNG